MKTIDEYTDRNNNHHKIIYIKNIHSTPYREWFLQTCKEVIEQGHAYDVWDYSNIKYSSIIWLKNDKPFLHFSFVIQRRYKMLADIFIYASPEARYKKYPLKLMEYAKQWGKENGFVCSSGLIHVNNKQSINFWEKIGGKKPFYFAIIDF
jgi:GNAT superfamily N-acetyltransferase